MTDWFDWNGKRCTDYGIHVSQQPDIIQPAERATFTSVPGRSGTLTTVEGKDVYDDFILSVECLITDLSKLTAICGWLRGGGRVTFAHKQGGYYEARIVNQISFEQVLRGNPHRTFAVNFRCQPFFYLTGIPDITITSSYQIVNNPGNVFSEPVLRVTLYLNSGYLERHCMATKRMLALEETIRQRKNRARVLETFIRNIASNPQALTEFDERLREMAIDQVTVTPDGRFVFRFRDGSEVEV